ncbi:MAG: 2-oxo acid dehydrogenase subunit E2 [Candidatus Izemoplasma sp.]|nr:2-oxo acid dehydrogenase subunit E2 [Candidatus Izemoplasma sp.]
MRRFGDRSDGKKLRNVNPFFRVIPHLMPERNDAQVFFESQIDLEKTHEIIRELRKDGLKVGFLHVVIAAVVRTLSQRPKLNRFVRGKKTYARNEISISFALKRSLEDDGEETTVKVVFDPKDTLFDVVKKVNEIVEENKDAAANNNTDKAAKFFNLLPNFLLSFTIGFIKFLDNRGKLPKFLINLSPFHSSVFVTDLGSLKIDPIYHHIYNFGTNSIFIAFGIKRKEHVVNNDMEIEKRKKMNLKIVADERIVDGFYFAKSLRLSEKYMENPRLLLDEPKEVFEDDEI